MDVLKSNIHGANGNGDILEAGEEVEKMVRGKGELCGLDILRAELQSAKRQGRSESRGSRAR